ncbi:hypothetical protein JW898_00030 [Candidatus Woesearchaeota archaeon]|nr:hypothetical protein [Candidatus Woesearchaeota archaeon]
MRKLFTVLTVLVFVFAVLAFGCARKAEPSPAPVQQVPVPEMGQVQPAEEEVIAPPAPAPEPESEVPATIGTRVEGTEQEAVEEELPEEVEEIQLTPEKTMTSGNQTVSVGTTLYWKNHDSWPHQLAVESGKGFDTVRHAESPRLLQGNVWNYTFSESGLFVVRDIFSGNMRMYVTVE